MRGAFVAVVGALAITLAIVGLMENAGRAGPIEAALQPVAIDAAIAGSYHAVAAATGPGGLCLQPPCQATASLDLRIDRLPGGPYEAQLEGATIEPLGPLERDGEALVLRWSSSEDHTDKRRLTLTLAGQGVATIDVRPTAAPLALDGPLRVSWDAPQGTARLAEIGGVTVSTFAVVQVDGTAPAGWSFHARLEGASGARDLGALESAADASRLEARAERLRLEEQTRLVVVLRPQSAEPEAAGLPILQARLAIDPS